MQKQDQLLVKAKQEKEVCYMSYITHIYRCAYIWTLIMLFLMGWQYILDSLTH